MKKNNKPTDLEIYFFCHKNILVTEQMKFSGMKNLNDIHAAYQRVQRDIYMHIVDIAAREVIDFAEAEGTETSG